MKHKFNDYSPENKDALKGGTTPFSLPEYLDEEILNEFLNEQDSVLSNMENRLLSLEKNIDKETLDDLHRIFHTLKGEAAVFDLHDIQKLCHKAEDLIVCSSDNLSIDVLLNVKDWLKVFFDTLKSERKVIKLNEKMLSILRLQNYESVSKIEKTSAQDVFSSENISQHKKSNINESIKVNSGKLDNLMDTIGELLIIESMIMLDPEIKTKSSSNLMRNIAQMDKITRELQHHVMSLRMISVKGTFQKMARVVRDIAKKSNKKIDFHINGEDTMIDKSVVDRIGDPLIHLIRNSVDHGIEQTAEDRKRAGKKETGRIDLMAYHKDGNIYIEIKDDGRGLDKKAILKKAREKGLIRDGQNLTDKEITSLILLPGFSTAEKVTDVSGRGVGMDVVKKNIEELRGNVEILSEHGKGSVFRLRLP